jgi:DNA-binding transcriptional LysR family regulator
LVHIQRQPRSPQDLTNHECINLGTPIHGGVYPWEFDKDGREFRVRVEGQLVFNNSSLMLNAAVDGLGLAYLPEEQVQAELADGRLIRVLATWCQPFTRRPAAPAVTAAALASVVLPLPPF